MKSLLIIFIFFQNCFFLQAQFYTVSKQSASYKVQKQQDLPEVGEVSKDDSSTKVGKSKAECPNEWIQQYLSVSYPLDKMVVNSPYGWRPDPISFFSSPITLLILLIVKRTIVIRQSLILNEQFQDQERPKNRNSQHNDSIYNSNWSCSNFNKAVGVIDVWVAIRIP